MAVKASTTLTYECDRCGTQSTYPSSDKAYGDGWIRLSHPLDEIVLCPIDASKLRRFLQGQKTPASMRFNDDELARWRASCT